MKKVLFVIIFCGLSIIVNAQSASVENDTKGIQVGLVGIWAHKETKLTNQIALRTEIGFDAGFWGGTFYPRNGFLLTPVIRLEPRWYYNLNKRVEKSKKISGNSGNFLTLQTNYNPNWFVISNYEVEIADQISLIPTWGIKRNLGHFTYEAGIGIGYRYIFSRSIGFSENVDEVAANVHFRIGYRF